MTDLHLIWTVAGKVVHGYDVAAGNVIDGMFSHGPVFPGTVTEPQTVLITSSCVYDRSEFFLSNLRIFLEADPKTAEVLEGLAKLGHGVQTSFNDGWSWANLTTTPIMVGNKAIITNPDSGVLGPYDTLKIKFRVSTPSNFSFTGKLSYRIGMDFDVL